MFAMMIVVMSYWRAVDGGGRNGYGGVKEDLYWPSSKVDIRLIRAGSS
jgi:hypothetical protein